MTHGKKRPADPEIVGPDRHIVLVGMMGAGKTTIGKRLAERLGLAFRDADAEIEKAAGMSIAELFAAHGEESFRKGEAQVIARLLCEPAHVLATGGGAVLSPQTRRLIKEKALSIWIRADIDMLMPRVARRKTRPLLNNGDPREALTRLLAARAPLYAEADITVESQPGPAARTVKAVLAAIAARRDAEAP